MDKRLFSLLLMVLFALSTLFVAAGCSGDDDDDDAADDDASDDDASDDDADDDVADDDATDDDSVGDTWTGDETVTISTPEGDVDVDLNGLAAFAWTDPEDGVVKQAVLVSTVVEAAFAAKDFDPADYKYNFIATDDYDILAMKADGDFRILPSYEQLAQGWFYEYVDEDTSLTDIQVFWDEDLGLPGYMGAKLMNGGTIQMVENNLFTESVTVTVTYPDVSGEVVVNLQGMPAFDDEGVQAVYLHLIVLEANFADFDPDTYTYEFNFISNDDDGNWSLKEDLDIGEELPTWEDFESSQDMHHGWIENTAEDGYRLFWDDATGFPGKFSVKFMDEGTIEVLIP